VAGSRSAARNKTNMLTNEHVRAFTSISHESAKGNPRGDYVRLQTSVHLRPVDFTPKFAARTIYLLVKVRGANRGDASQLRKGPHLAGPTALVESIKIDSLWLN
jgi:hypothetical protein